MLAARLHPVDALADEALREVLSRGLIGRSEREVAIELAGEMRALGAEGESFPAIVAAGAHAALPHAQPRDVAIERGQLFGDAVALRRAVSGVGGILHLGGTLLGTTNRGNPFRYIGRDAAGELPGDTMPPMTALPSSVLPKLPAAVTTTIPASTARCTAWHSGSSL